jgi:glycosyltransferase involved in cell wall biosynthesis
MTQRRVLLVAREFPPSGGAPAIRLTKLAKYLPGLGWEVEVLTIPEDHAWSPDPTLLDELPAGLAVHRVARLLAAAMDPAKGTSGAAGELRPGWRRRLATALLMPDPALLWAIPALREARRLAPRLDAVLTSAPPFSTHLVGLGLAGRLAWVADYRDNWTTNPDFRRGAVPHALNRFLERRVLSRAGAVTVVSETARSELLRFRPGLAGRVQIAINGFDPDDLPRAQPDRELFRVVYAGSMGEHRDPAPLIRALACAAREDPELGTRLRLELIGRIPGSVKAQAQTLLGERISTPGFVAHREALRRSAAAAVLVVLSSRAEAGEAALTSKLFECLALRRPVLFIGPAGPGAALVRRLDAGEVVEPGDEGNLAAAVQRLFEAWRRGRERVATRGALQPLTRVATAEAVAAALDLAMDQVRRY